MYRYDEVDERIVRERVEQYRDQTRRFLAGELTEDEFRPLRLMNGLYVQRHAPMLRVAVPYGHLRSVQLRKLAHIARTYDKGYAHFTTRQNVQFNWLKRWKPCRISCRNWPTWKCTRSRPPATACATPRPMLSPVWRRMS
ncbi:hypothetical protein [Paludibacterium denitrificans]|uniref:hypothetical protein n=1 Tax=Paludibacterium denitrificans TaxID=2675226 RepID=UPI001FDA7BA8|nr:hypothetical protein [Paludibacterium denitrificans]